MTYKTIEEWIEHNPNHRGALPIEVCHQIFGTKDTQIETVDDDDIQDYKRPWVGLTRNEQSFVYHRLHDATSRIDSFWVDFANAIEAKLKEKNT